MHISNYTGEQIEEAVGKVLDGKVGGMTPITYKKLVDLRNESKLIPGMQYRITDYETVANQHNVETDGRKFDIIVTADNEKILNENARSIQHDGCDDFKDENLASWELKYALTNENGLYFWGIDGDVITFDDGYYSDHIIKNNKVTIDGNEYYRLNIQTNLFVSSNYESDSNLYQLNENMSAQLTIVEIIDNDTIKCEEYDGEKYNYFNFTVDKNKIYTFLTLEGEYYKIKDRNYYVNCDYDVTYSVCEYDSYFEASLNYDYIKPSKETKGVIYYMKDEFNNECPYDFKTIKFAKNGNLQYTFGKNCHDNIIKSYFYNNKYLLNSNTFGNDCYNNTFGNDCYSNTFGNNCYTNTFSNNFYINTFGDNCSSNKFGKNCYNNTFGDNCSSNKFGKNCYNNAFGEICSSNSFGESCSSNSFGESCSSNEFGNYCGENTFGKFCKNNTFGNGCQNNTFGDNNTNNRCENNTFGNSCDNNTLNDCDGNIFGNDCTNFNISASNNNTIGSGCYNKSFTNSYRKQYWE